MFKLTITLKDGWTQSFTVKRMPRHWKSWLMQQVPYGLTINGTGFMGAEFKRETI